MARTRSEIREGVDVVSHARLFAGVACLAAALLAARQRSLAASFFTISSAAGWLVLRWALARFAPKFSDKRFEWVIPKALLADSWGIERSRYRGSG
jgi:hypothetical protein